MTTRTAAPIKAASLHLTPGDAGRFLTREQFMSADAQEGFRYELVHGRLEVSPLADLPHERLRKWLERQFDDYAETHPHILNAVVGPGRLFLPEQGEAVTAPEADLVFPRNFPLDLDEDQMSWDHGEPIIAVEVISEGTQDKDLERNPELYLQFPTILEYWILDAREKGYSQSSMIVYRRRGKSWQKSIKVPAGGTYESRFLPDFRLVLDRRRKV